MFTLIEHGNVFAPEPLGTQSVLLVGARIARIGATAPDRLQALGLPFTVLNAGGCLLVPGFVDPHQHLIGAGGEQGFASRQPEVPFEALIRAGITTVIGCLGTDTVTRHLTTLLARVRQLTTKGLSAFMYTGGFPVPPPTFTGSVQSDLVLIDPVIGVGEIAIADLRATKPRRRDLAQLVTEAYVGGTLSGKAGVTHFHVGPGRDRLSALHSLLDHEDAAPEQLYPTHINRSDRLMDEAVMLAQRGSFVDIDAAGEEGVGGWVRYYLAQAGPPDRLTISSDAHTPGGSPDRLYQAFVTCVRDLGLSPDAALRPFTKNPARALKLPNKGHLCEGADADLLVIDQDTLQVKHLFAAGRHLLADGRLTELAGSAADSSRHSAGQVSDHPKFRKESTDDE